MKLLLISNSTNAGEEYLRYPLPEIGRFLDGVREIVFVPYAAVTFSYAEYEKKVQVRFAELGIRVRSVHRAKDPAALIRTAEAVRKVDPEAVIIGFGLSRMPLGFTGRVLDIVRERGKLEG